MAENGTFCPVCGKNFVVNVAFCEDCGWLFGNDITALSDPLSVSADDIRAYDLRVYEARMKVQNHINDNMIAVFARKLSAEQLNIASNSLLAEIFNSVSPLLGDAIIKKLCDDTQFILITHRRGTMEVGDTLYGVTMAERGISRVLAINVNEVEAKLGVKL